MVLKPQTQPNARLVNEDGRLNTGLKNARKSEFCALLNRLCHFHTLVNYSWCCQFILFYIAFLVSWGIFAIIYLLVDKFYKSWGSDCVTGVSNLLSSILFSMETFSTVGYGSHYINNNCVIGACVLNNQNFVGMFLTAALQALFIAKKIQLQIVMIFVSFHRNQIILSSIKKLK